MLQDLIRERHDDIVERTRARLTQRRAPRATEQEIEQGVPLFLRQLATFIEVSATGDSSDDIGTSATIYGGQLLRRGFSIAQVVHGYGDVCQAVTELAHEQNLAVSAEEFRLLNLALDNAIAGAATEFTRLREQATSQRNTENIGSLAHEMRNFLNTATLAFALVKDGKVASGGSTGAVVTRSLEGMRQLIDRSLAEVRLNADARDLRPLRVAELFEELEVAAAIQASSRELELVVLGVDYDVQVAADQGLLASAVSNLLQNAMKFTHAHSLVTLRAIVSAEKVAIEVEDQCGGLPAGKAEELFRPFEQRASDRSGVGLGLAISKRAVEANGGTMSVRDLPGQGCVFAIELPRLQENRVQPGPKFA